MKLDGLEWKKQEACGGTFLSSSASQVELLPFFCSPALRADISMLSLCLLPSQQLCLCYRCDRQIKPLCIISLYPSSKGQEWVSGPSSLGGY